MLLFLTNCDYYSHVYNYCTSVDQSGSSRQGPSSNASPTTAGRGASKRGQGNSGAYFVGLELYKKLKQYLQSYLTDILKVFLFVSLHIQQTLANPHLIHEIKQISRLFLDDCFSCGKFLAINLWIILSKVF